MKVSGSAILASVAFALLSSSSASAVVVTSSTPYTTPQVYAPGTILVDFEDVVAPIDNPFVSAGFSFTAIAPGGGGGVRNSSSSGIYAQPAGSTGNYFTTGFVANGGYPSPQGLTSQVTSAIDYTFFSLLWGSIDQYNTISFYDGATQVAQYSGSAFAAPANGNQVIPATNRYVTFSFQDGLKFDTVRFNSTQAAFEVDNLAFSGPAGAPGAVPEASTWMMMMLGFMGLGFASYRKTSRRRVRLA